jgi:hypothetical protein
MATGRMGRPQIIFISKREVRLARARLAVGVTRRRIALDMKLNYQRLCALLREEK